MNDFDKRDLWRDALDAGIDPAFNAASLARTLAYARLRRRRAAAGGIAAIAVAACIVLGVLTRFAAPLPSAPMVRQPSPAVSPRSPEPALAQVHFLSDEELLNRFSGRPRALIGPADHQRLVFLDDPEPEAH